MLSVILPASNEARYIAACLTALLASKGITQKAEVIVVANGCHDDTAAIARSFAARARDAGWQLTVVELAEGSKPAALNAGDAVARYPLRLYLDADVTVTPTLVAELLQALQDPAPCYVSGTPHIPRPHSAISRAYARFWQRLPFAQSVAPGYGLFATNAAGRTRWGTFPAIISDDTYVRLHFAPAERIQCAARYSWPMIEGFSPLVRVRRRQDAGLHQIKALYPALMANEGKAPLTLGRLTALALQAPLGFAAYALVSLAVRFRRGPTGWARGR